MLKLSIYAISFYCIANMSWMSDIVNYSKVLWCFLFCLNSYWNSPRTERRFYKSFFCSTISFFCFLFFCFISRYTLSKLLRLFLLASLFFFVALLVSVDPMKELELMSQIAVESRFEVGFISSRSANSTLAASSLANLSASIFLIAYYL